MHARMAWHCMHACMYDCMMGPIPRGSADAETFLYIRNSVCVCVCACVLLMSFLYTVLARNKGDHLVFFWLGCWPLMMTASPSIFPTGRVIRSWATFAHHLRIISMQPRRTLNVRDCVYGPDHCRTLHPSLRRGSKRARRGAAKFKSQWRFHEVVSHKKTRVALFVSDAVNRVSIMEMSQLSSCIDPIGWMFTTVISDQGA